MKKQLIVCIIAILIFTIFNIIGGIINDKNNYTLGLTDVIEAGILHLVFLSLYLITCRFNWKLRNSIRLPLIQSIFWILLFGTDFLSKGEITIATADFYDAIIPAFFFPLNYLSISNIIPFDEIIFSLLFLFLYKILVLESSSFISEYLLTKKLNHTSTTVHI